MLKAIETHYNGYRFRSRLEARWAVFFDALNIPYWYEHQGFELPRVGKYLPDFLFPEINLFAEVKPQERMEEDWKKPVELSIALGGPVVMLSEVSNYSHILIWTGKDEGGRGWASFDLFTWELCPVCNAAAIIVVNPPEHGWHDEHRVLCTNRECTARKHFLCVKQVPESSSMPIVAAREAARSARFEFGETPRGKPGKRTVGAR